MDIGIWVDGLRLWARLWGYRIVTWTAGVKRSVSGQSKSYMRHRKLSNEFAYIVIRVKYVCNASSRKNWKRGRGESG